LQEFAGIEYKVQISATRKSPVRNNDFFSSKYKLTDNVELTYHDGWKKYLIGKFENYKQANAYRKQTQQKVSDAFVVAYDNGMRIPLSDARKKQKLNQ
jgi:N-acetylmuramoyl-L-alanine amidase